MAIYEFTDHEFRRLAPTSFAAERIMERDDLQRVLRQSIHALSDDLLVIAEEFCDWEDSSRRIDLLCLDKEANLVVVELKRTNDGGHMDLQAIRYASMISTMTYGQMVATHAKQHNQDITASEKEILRFLQWKSPEEAEFATETKIILAAGDFSKELTTSVMWLNRSGLSIRCVRLKPYKTVDGRMMVDVQQIIPLPEATEYQTRIQAKEQVERQQWATRHDKRFEFWSELLDYAKSKTNLHANRSASKYNWIGGSIGKTGFSLNYALRKFDAQVELYINLESEISNLEALSRLAANKTEIEAAYGGALQWETLEDRRCCRIRDILPGGWKSPQEEWPDIQVRLVDAMVRLDRALRSKVQELDV